MVQKNKVPIVATIEGIPIFVTNKPFIKPANMPKDVDKIKEIKKFPSVAVKSIPKVSDVIPTIEGNDKSISPRVTTNVVISGWVA